MSNSSRNTRGRQSARARRGHRDQGIMLGIRSGRTRVTFQEFRNFSKAEVDQLYLRLTEGRGQVFFEIADIHLLADEQRWLLVNLMHQAEARSRVTVDGAEQQDVLSGVLTAMRPIAELQAHSAGRKAAIETAAVFFPSAVAEASESIAQRFRELGGSPSRVQIQASIQGLISAGESHGQAGGAAAMLARVYLSDLNAGANSACNGPMLVWYGEEFYRYEEQKWRRISDSAMRAEVTRFLQRQPSVEIDTKLIADVLLNLQALVYLKRTTIEMPFYIESVEPPVFAVRDCIACSNGILDMDDPSHLVLAARGFSRHAA
jgi:hypothetical protein